MNELFWTQNSNLPRLEVTVSGNGAAEDLSNATGLIYYYKSRYSGVSTTLSGQFLSKSSGIVYVDLTGSTMTNNVGPCWGKFLVYFQNGGVLAYPRESYINFEIISGG